MKGFFRFFLILTFIGSGANALSYLCIALMQPVMLDTLPQFSSVYPEEVITAVTQMLQMPRILFLLLGLTFAASLVGAIYMWKLRTFGLHIYAIAQIVAIGLPLLFMGVDGFDFGNVMITAFFIIFYYVALRRLREDDIINDDNEILPTQNDDDDDEDDED